jgi:hypothetical protein
MRSLSRPAPRQAAAAPARRHARRTVACQVGCAPSRLGWLPPGPHNRHGHAQATKLPEALLFDCDGVLVDTEKDGHRVSFNEAFKRKGKQLRLRAPAGPADAPLPADHSRPAGPAASWLQ